jgi:hypothetical protein
MTSEPGLHPSAHPTRGADLPPAREAVSMSYSSREDKLLDFPATDQAIRPQSAAVRRQLPGVFAQRTGGAFRD